MNFTDKTLWITGASSGIGAELAKQYSKRNINLIISARRAEVLLEVKESSKGGAKIEILPFDIKSRLQPSLLSQIFLFQFYIFL